MSLENEVLSAVSPSEQERKDVENCAQMLVQELSEDEDVLKNGVQVMLVGSVAKGTYLRRPDIDLFLQFPEEFDKKEMQKIGLKIGKNHLDSYEERYAEHPYMHGTRCGYELDIVPCYRIASAEDLKCAVDRTPFHTRYIKENMSKEMKEEVRLLKQFTKGIGVYGAESKVEGMSGYLIELLVLKYGSFLNVIEAASSWKRGHVLFPKKGPVFKDALSVHDPVDSRRNVASALSEQSFSLFVHASKEYMKTPSQNFFFPKKRDLIDVRAEMKRRSTHVILAELDRPDLIDDNLYPQVKKNLEGILSVLSRENVDVLDYAYYVSDKVQYAVEVGEITLPPLILHDGPAAWNENSSSFLEKWGAGEFKPFIRDGVWHVHVRRKERDVSVYLRNSLKSASLGKDFRDLKGLEITSDTFDEKYLAVISAMLDKRMNWEIV